MPTLVIAGPSGSGKTTLQEALVKLRPDLYFRAVSHTTRAKRDGEENNKAYHFVDAKQFDALKPQFVEWAEYCGNCYGSGIDAKKCPVDKVCVQVLEPNGCKVYMEQRDDLDASFVFVKAPVEELVRRIEAERPDAKARTKDIEETLKFGEETKFDLVIDGESPEVAVALAHALIVKRLDQIKQETKEEEEASSRKRKAGEGEEGDPPEVMEKLETALGDVASFGSDPEGRVICYTGITDKAQMDEVGRKAVEACGENASVELDNTGQIIVHTGAVMGNSSKRARSEDPESLVPNQHADLGRYQKLAVKALGKYYTTGEVVENEGTSRPEFEMECTGGPNAGKFKCVVQADGAKVLLAFHTKDNVKNVTLKLNDELFLAMAHQNATGGA